MVRNGVKMQNGFPSDQVPPAEKGKEWCLQFLRSFHNEYSTGGGKVLRYAAKDYEKYRSYAKGSQDIDQYKKMLGTQKRKGKKDQSWRNLDWNIYSVIPTLAGMVKGKVLGQKKDILIKGIDTISQNEERARRNKILTYLTNLPLMQQANQELGVPIDSPLEAGAPIPANAQEVELHMQMYPKDRYVMELYDQIELTQSINNWKQIWDDVVTDLIEVGVAGTKAYLDINGVIRVRRIIPERLITNPCVASDFSDVTRVGEYIEMSISELRAAVPRGTFTEEDLAKIAAISSGQAYNTIGIETFFRTNYRYPYDHEKVLILDAEWISADDLAYVVDRSSIGNINIERQKDPYWLNRVKWQGEDGKAMEGVSDQQYADFNMKRGADRKVVRDSITNLYGGKFIIGTNHVFDYGLKSNIQRSINRLGDCKTNYNLYTFFDSVMRRAEPLADDVQRNWLHYQNMQGQAKPNGMKINKRALTSLSVAGKGGAVETLDELDMLQMYTETGNFIYKGEDAAGRPYPFDPIQELKGGINPAAVEYWNFIKFDIDALRNIFGLNEATDGSTPNPKLGKAIAEQLEQNTNTALTNVYHAYSKLFEDTVKSIALLVPDASLVKSNARDEALGISSDQFFRENNDITYREMGITIEDGPTSEARLRLQKYTELAIQAKELKADDAYLIENEGDTNIMRAYHLLAMKRRQKAEEDSQASQQMFQIENQKNIESAQATADAKLKADLQLLDAEIQKEQFLHPLRMKEISAQIVGQALLKKMELGAALTEQENEILASYQETLLKTQSQERIAFSQQASQEKIAADNKAAAKKKVA